MSVSPQLKEQWGQTTFASSPNGNVLIAKSVDRSKFYQILSSVLHETSHQRHLPPQVINRAKSAGIPGELWLTHLEYLITTLENKWHITVENVLTGGSHAFVAYAYGKKREEYVLKIDMPEDLGVDFSSSVEALKIAKGNGYAKLYADDLEKKACLIERLGPSLNQLGYPIGKQLQIICSTLQKTWQLPIENAKLTVGNVDWFEEFIKDAYEKQHHPCTKEVLDQALSYLASRKENEKPSEFVLIHGDPHNNNILQVPMTNDFKFIDPDGLIYEKAYDLGVLMREWVDDYLEAPLKNGQARCQYLHQLTGVSKQAIWEWGFIQMLSTSLVLLQIGQEDTAKKMLWVLENWAN